MTFHSPHDDAAGLDWLRSAMDLAVTFVIAVIVLRGFVLEGYLISTGSMAPGLLGFHKHLVCPSCQFPFAFGVSFDDSVDPEHVAAGQDDGTRRFATCPNCGQINIDVAEVPVSHGDQLLVHKHVYDFRRPARWETIVFRNPASPGEAYVKRVVGLPGETIQVVNGDIHIDGRIARKDYRAQRAMRIGVCDIHHLADSPLWEMSWQFEGNWQLDDGQMPGTAERPSSAVPSDDRDAKGIPADNQIRFRPWRWYGGRHAVETPLAVSDAQEDWAAFLERFDRLPVSWVSRIEYDREHEVLRCEGVIPAEMQRDLMAQARNDGFRRAVYRLAALSHLTVISDHYGYNAMVASPEFPVPDLMLRAVISWFTDPQQIQVQVPVDADVYTLKLLPRQQRLELYTAEERLIGEAPFSLAQLDVRGQEQQQTGLELEVSNFDRQILVAVNQRSVLTVPLSARVANISQRTNGGDLFSGAAIAGMPDIGKTAAVFIDGTSRLPRTESGAERAARAALLREQQSRWTLTISDAGIRLHELQMFRDVYYTPGRRRHAVDEPYTVPPDCYFVQGDNSPVSSDSRNWQTPGVPHRMLLGKPFLLHLPSRPAVLQLGSKRWPIRIPDWTRIGYIH